MDLIVVSVTLTDTASVTDRNIVMSALFTMLPLWPAKVSISLPRSFNRYLIGKCLNVLLKSYRLQSAVRLVCCPGSQDVYGIKRQNDKGVYNIMLLFTQELKWVPVRAIWSHWKRIVCFVMLFYSSECSYWLLGIVSGFMRKCYFCMPDNMINTPRPNNSGWPAVFECMSGKQQVPGFSSGNQKYLRVRKVAVIKQMKK